jgi:hypothetical protein
MLPGSFDVFMGFGLDVVLFLVEEQAHKNNKMMSRMFLICDRLKFDIKLVYYF